MNEINVSKLSYVTDKGNVILDDISFTINKGERIALLGSNGSGKTTLLELLLGIAKPTRGSISIEQNFSSLRSNYGVVWDQVEIFPWLKVKEVIRYFAVMRKLQSFELDICNFLGLHSIMERLMKTLSRGEKKKVAITVALMHNPHYVLLDEFSSDLDEQTIDSIWENYLKFGKTIIFSTHKWEEAEKYATKFMFLNNGKIVLPPMTRKEILENYPFHYKIVIGKEIPNEQKKDIEYYRLNEKTTILLKNLNEEIIASIRNITSNYSIVETDLTDIYNYLTKK
ncbi:ABC transporter ATP-binding protein [Hoylesella enoeca]|uniref:ABC transporter domain-containing protein n=1 Tax=Hoylesella enoeca TaxID=76123 RepID=A0A0S2KJ17_9BACT|nr:ABC transporter ATP-binding protein [Hoylesella enoeca]ALO48280.1 hypothetical protein AS203_03610 [Hoylesella enoeca]